ncbi:MAG: 30S ribosomal protein S18 [Tissierellia bacterium]|nr:30S ribosomal protein S18 [Tissierellia bacterium]
MQQRRFRSRRKVCAFCADKNAKIDYKDANRLRKYVSDRGKILPRRVTGACAKHQREITTAIKRARQIALLPYTAE